MSAKFVPIFADRGCRVFSATDPHGRILGFLDCHTHTRENIIEIRDLKIKAGLTCNIVILMLNFNSFYLFLTCVSMSYHHWLLGSTNIIQPILMTSSLNPVITRICVSPSLSTVGFCFQFLPQGDAWHNLKLLKKYYSQFLLLRVLSYPKGLNSRTKLYLGLKDIR
jgi:hypothetical protein